MDSNSTRHFPSTPQEERCLLSPLGSCCTSVSSRSKLLRLKCLLCLLFMSAVVTFVDVSFWGNSWPVASVSYGVNRSDYSYYNSIPVKAVQRNSHFDSYINSWRDQQPLKITIWFSPTLDYIKHRRSVVEELIVGSLNQDPCFRDKFKCAMTMNTGELSTADAIIFFMFNKGFLM